MGLVLCANNTSGNLAVAAQCKNETALTPATLAALGLQGRQGLPGPAGPVGPACPAGAIGATGAQGPAGPAGISAARFVELQHTTILPDRGDSVRVATSTMPAGNSVVVATTFLLDVVNDANTVT